MTQEKIIKFLAGATMAARNTSQIVSEKSTSYIEDNFLKGNYVSREEFNQLKNLVIKLEKQLLEKS
jgi:hypothetical protein